jgi:hypothetical protein
VFVVVAWVDDVGAASPTASGKVTGSNDLVILVQMVGMRAKATAAAQTTHHSRGSQVLVLGQCRNPGIPQLCAGFVP